ncbi:MAG: glycosyltransferase family 4 protein [Bacteroides sp.]|nr:glycosyltransferase family 4 protein [Bacteroides sp.]MCM1378737.1 glycosyltransferase family 4 protein [Bacteroides sp.]MCM1445354.1 glycosyltransferase family 4 protein [Prevotella sp.]
MNKTLVILARMPYNIYDRQFSVGGIQTYINLLSATAHADDFKVIICEYNRDSKEEGVIETEKFTVYYRPYPVKRNGALDFQKAYDYWVNKFNAPGVVFVVESDQQTFKSNLPNVIQIQHGVAFDFPNESIDGFWGKSVLLKKLRKYLSCLRNEKRLHQVRNTVCVDYNFYNWFRCIGSIKEDEKVSVIPNFTVGKISEDELAQKWQEISEKKCLNVVFARRFVEHRGAILFANVAKRLLDENELINVTFAGEGPSLGAMKEILRKYLDSKVKFTSYKASESISFHKDYAITVVPTIYSEGTSLSLAEAMSAGCIPVCTHVGGMTNMVIDSYNGFLCSPNEDSVYQAIKSAIHLPTKKLQAIALNAYKTSTDAFNLELWKSRWIKVLNSVLNDTTQKS